MGKHKGHKTFVPLVLKRESDQNVNLRPSRAIRGFMISSV
jgi:hypothetical protein